MWNYEAQTFFQGMIGFAGFWRRLLAFVIDIAVLSLAASVIVLLLASTLLFAPNFAGILFERELARIALAVLAFLATWLYFAGFESSSSLGTIGKSVLGIAIVNLDGSKLTFSRATLRYFAKWLSLLALGVGFAMIAFDRRKQGLHDRLVGTLAILRDPFLPPPQL